MKKNVAPQFGNMTIGQLYGALTDALNDLAGNYARACSILTELKARGETHPAMHRGSLRWHEEVTAGRLSPKAAFCVAEALIPRLVDLPLATQDRIAGEMPIEVAEITPKGEIEIARKPLFRMTTVELDLALDRGRFRPAEEQEKLLRAKLAPATIAGPAPVSLARVRVDDTGKLLRIGVMKIAPDELREALRVIGYDLVWIGKRAPVAAE